MRAKITDINVQNLGPIQEIRWEMGLVNLIFGENEKGKSYLVEFLVRSLFKSAAWKLRKTIGSGRVRIEGIDDDVTEFSPTSSKKLEDFLIEKYVGLPPDFSKLLVMRSTDVELSEAEETDKLILRRFLSHREILERIQENISKTIRQSEVRGYEISGGNRGEIKTRKALENDLRRINGLFDKIESHYLGGHRKTLEIKKQVLEAQFELLSRAKCHLAYDIWKTIEDLQGESDDIDEAKLQKLLDSVRDYNKGRGEYSEKKDELADLKKNTKDYEWLENAIDEYEQYNLGMVTSKPGFLYPSSVLVMTIICALFTALRIPVVALIALATLVLIGWVYKRMYDQYLRDASKGQERARLQKEYERRFNEGLTDLALMKEKLQAMKQDYDLKKLLADQLSSKKRDLSDSKIRTLEDISEFIGEEIPSEDWKEELEKKKQEKKELEDRIHKNGVKLAELRVDPTQYVKEKAEVEFDEEEFGRIEAGLSKVEGEISRTEDALDTIKQGICDATDSDISTDWHELIAKLAERRDQTLKEYRDITAQIIGKRFVFETLEELNEVEDEEVKSALESDDIKKTLREVTKHYDNIFLEGDSMIVSDPYSSFPLSEISDGAKEQVFLALRIGFAVRWFKKDGLFLVLDDAFLHSDYKRRPLLVNRVVELARNGWQIICFTFDENIRKLFEKVSAEFGSEYRYFDLNEDTGKPRPA
ncbi:hypothetical protein E3J62_06635 [candidate division TA06 bacterium]|uniref:Rad50/SbcC-type AAA domain-containing protein n=1 Tax=candidate division TA06 bacterium TaxID=2250710 RepID=A0A523UT57_UNCT6|nr:MAG: hypothetical protein E3J62_06635 [candidate division TA06 bacterium]